MEENTPVTDFSVTRAVLSSTKSLVDSVEEKLNSSSFPGEEVLSSHPAEIPVWEQLL